MIKNSDILCDLSQYLNNELGFYPRRTKLVNVVGSDWKELCLSNNWNSDNSGAFSPKTLKAYIKSGDKFEDLNVIHELFGHGLFFEYHPIGRAIVFAEQKNLSKQKQELLSLAENFPEIFAIWIEKFFSRYLEKNCQFDEKYTSIINNDLERKLERFDILQNKFGLFGMFASLGFPKYYDGNRARSLLDKAYGKEKLKDSRIGVIYGSRKPYSDIDFFIVSDETKSYDSSWLDIFSKTKQEFERDLGLFAVSLRDPLLDGELIFGDRAYYDSAIQKWQTQPITEEAIKYNIQRHRELSKIADSYPLDHKKRKIAKSYSESYLRNALALRSGRRF